MSYEEAVEWLLGKRTWQNIIPQYPLETYMVRTAEADAHATEQAYWIVRAHNERILPKAQDKEREG